MSHQTNITRIKAVYNALAGLDRETVFVGGAVVSFYADRPAEEVRPTEDVDVLVEIYTRMDFTLLEEKLRSLGFAHDTSSSFVGRFLMKGLIVDIMPLEEQVLGFNNRWYLEGFKNAMEYVIDPQHTVRLFTAPYFLAAKLEAFKSRGKNQVGEYDGRMSTDFEDMVYVWVNRATIWDELNQVAPSLKQYMQSEYAILMSHPNFEEWIDAHTGYVSPAAQYIVLPKMKKFIQPQ